MHSLQSRYMSRMAKQLDRYECAESLYAGMRSLASVMPKPRMFCCPASALAHYLPKTKDFPDESEAR